MSVTMKSMTDPLTGDILVQIRISPTMTRTDGEFKWRLIQAITLALTEKEAKYAGADTPEGLTRLIGELR